jgi:glycosyltransferase involved in cell wall biosynthesis
VQIAFYAPLKAPSHQTPSGDRRVGRLLIKALSEAGHQVEVASEMRSFCRTPVGNCFVDRKHEAELEAARLIAEYKSNARSRPDIWFTYHVYYKAPDWIGPAVAAAVGIPYVIVEASHAPKRSLGPWAVGHQAAEQAIQAADLIVNLTRADMACVAPVAKPDAMFYLAPFLDPAPFQLAQQNRESHRRALASSESLDPRQPWLLAVAMMRPGPKTESYLLLADSLGKIADRKWQLVIVGDGECRAQIENAFQKFKTGKITFLGEQTPDDLPGIYAAADLYVWPSIHEAYGMALLEAAAAGTPVIAADTRGVPDVVESGVTGTLVVLNDAAAFAGAVAELLDDHSKRAAMGVAAMDKVAGEHSLAHAAGELEQMLASVVVRFATNKAAE